jgi:hypothetical protein
MGKSYNILVGKPEEDLGVHRKIILELVLEK